MSLQNRKLRETTLGEASSILRKANGQPLSESQLVEFKTRIQVWNEFSGQSVPPDLLAFQQVANQRSDGFNPFPEEEVTAEEFQRALKSAQSTGAYEA